MGDTDINLILHAQEMSKIDKSAIITADSGMFDIWRYGIEEGFYNSGSFKMFQRTHASKFTPVSLRR